MYEVMDFWSKDQSINGITAKWNRGVDKIALKYIIELIHSLIFE